MVNELGRIGTQLVIPYRCPEMQIRHLKPAGDLGQITPLEFDPYDYESIKEMVSGCNVVVNLTGKRFETTHWSFKAVHCDLPEAIAMACAEEGVTQFIHFSALGADKDSSSAVLATKAAGEAAVTAAFPAATIMRPGPVIGQEDSYMTFFKGLTEMPGPLMGSFPLINGGANKQQPITAVDVGKAVAAAVDTTASLGATYELAGPEVYTVKELASLMFDAIKKPEKSFVPLPKQALDFYLGTVGLRLPLVNQVPSQTEDMGERLTLDLVKSDDAMGMEDLGLTPDLIVKNMKWMEMYCHGGARQTFLETN